MCSKWGRWFKLAGINELKTLANVTSVNVTLMVKNVTWIKTGITINVGVSVKIHKSIVCTKNFGNPATCGGENSKYEGSIIDVSLVA